jgi:hypothetical protein
MEATNVDDAFKIVISGIFDINEEIYKKISK